MSGSPVSVLAILFSGFLSATAEFDTGNSFFSFWTGGLFVTTVFVLGSAFTTETSGFLSVASLIAATASFFSFLGGRPFAEGEFILLSGVLDSVLAIEASGFLSVDFVSAVRVSLLSSFLILFLATASFSSLGFVGVFSGAFGFSNASVFCRSRSPRCS